MSRTWDEVRKIDSNEFTWYKCVECGFPEILEISSATRVIDTRGKKCYDCHMKIVKNRYKKKVKNQTK